MNRIEKCNASNSGHSSGLDLLTTIEGYIEKSGRFWIVQIPEFEGMTQGRSRNEALMMAGDWIRCQLNDEQVAIEARYVSLVTFWLTLRTSEKLSALRKEHAERRRKAAQRSRRAGMLLKEFRIGKRFYNTFKEWICTDIGTRTICAIEAPEHARSMSGPPYTVEEHVFDEYSMEDCGVTKELVDRHFAAD